MSGTSNCIACSKRKVRCDRRLPCSHCKRRKGDTCVYPVPFGSSQNGNQNSAVERSQSERIARLEEYIRSLGQKPKGVDPGEIRTTTSPDHPAPASVSAVSDRSMLDDNMKRQSEMASCTTTDSRNTEQARLVEHGEDTTYVEAPVWYSWSEAKQPGGSGQSAMAHNLNGYSATFLEGVTTDDGDTIYQRHPSSKQVLQLWNHYLSNVHPMTKLLFNWEKAPIFQKAAKDTQMLSNAEHAFSFSVYFITILSLSNDECKVVMGNSSKSQLLNDIQPLVERALVMADIYATSDLLVLQAFLHYLIAMRNRARPAIWFSLMGIAVRVAQRIGLHRDGSQLGLSIFQTEEKRRVWWQLQHMEVMISQVLGLLSLSIYAHWDVKMPSNIEDEDIGPETKVMPPDRPGLTSMSHCLWRYYVLFLQRSPLKPDGRRTDFAWITSSSVAVPSKDAVLERMSRVLSEKFIQYCELLNPLHVSIQIGIRGLILAMKRVMRQPKVSNATILDMPPDEREEFLKISVECLEYYILGETTPSIAHFRWFNEYFFQWPAFVYVIIEAHYRATTPDVTLLWNIISKVCEVHPKLNVTPDRSDIIAIGRLIIIAWHQRQEYLDSTPLTQVEEKPSCVTRLEEALNFTVQATNAPDVAPWWDESRIMAMDFDMIDWSGWEQDGGVGDESFN